VYAGPRSTINCEPQRSRQLAQAPEQAPAVAPGGRAPARDGLAQGVVRPPRVAGIRRAPPFANRHESPCAGV